MWKIPWHTTPTGKSPERPKRAVALCASQLIIRPPICVKQHNKASLSPAHRDLCDECGALCGQTVLVSSSSMPRSHRTHRGRRYRSPTLNSFRMRRGNGWKKKKRTACWMCSKFTSTGAWQHSQTFRRLIKLTAHLLTSAVDFRANNDEFKHLYKSDSWERHIFELLSSLSGREFNLF